MAAKPQPVRDRLVTAQARRFELLNEKSAGETLPAAQVAREWAGIVATVKARLIAVPRRVEAAHPGNRAIIDTVEREIKAALASLADDR